MKAISWRIERSYRRRLLDADLEDVKANLQGQVLEVGAGRTGRRGVFRPPQTRTWITVDRSAPMRPDVVADALALPFGHGTFDSAVCLEVLEYVREPAAAMRELARVVRRGGMVVVSVPFGHRQDTPSDHWRLTGAGSRALAEDAGFEVVELRAQGGALTVVANTLRHAVMRASPLLRVALAAFVLPVGEILFGADRLTRDRSFTTGHLLVVRRR